MLPPYDNPRHAPEIKECVLSLVSEVVTRGGASDMQHTGSAKAAATSQFASLEKPHLRSEAGALNSEAKNQTNLTVRSNRKGLSMNPGAIRARERRRREKEEKLRKQQELNQNQHVGDIGLMHVAHASTHDQLSVSGGGPLGSTTASSSSGYNSYASNYKATLHGSKAPQSIAYSSGAGGCGVSNVVGGNPAGEYQPKVGRRSVGRPVVTGMPHETHDSQSKKAVVPPKPFVPPLPPPLSSLEGDQTLAASILPPQFPIEESFRALSCYALLRTLSLPLRLSPFTPTAFLRSLTIPVISKLLGEIHVSILKFLFVDIGRGADFTHLASAQTSSLFDGKVGRPRHRAPSTEDGDGEGYMGSENLNYMDEFTWPLFYVDYVEATEGRFRSALETEQEGTYRGKVTGHDASSLVMEEVDEEAGGSTKKSAADVKVDDAVEKSSQRQSLLTSTLLDLLKQMKRRCDTYGFFSRPVDPIQDQCPDYFQVVDRHREAMDLGTMEDLIRSGVIMTFVDFEIYLRRIVHCARKYNTDEENFVRIQTEKFDEKAFDLLKKTKSSFVADHGDDDDAVASKGNANSSDELLSAIQNKNRIVSNGKTTRRSANDVNDGQNEEVEQDSDTSMEEDEPDDDEDNDQTDESEFSLTGDSDVDERPRKKRPKIDNTGISTVNEERQGGDVVRAPASASPPVVKMEDHAINEGHGSQQVQDETHEVGKEKILATAVPSHSAGEKVGTKESGPSCESNRINVNREEGSSQFLPVTNPSADLREIESVVKRNDGIQGVFSDINGQWCAKLTHEGDVLDVGSFKSPTEASKAFEEEYRRINGSSPPSFSGKITSDSGVDQNKPKRGRGRPRKNEGAPSEPPVSSVDKKKRGRPPKSTLSHRKSKTSRGPSSMTPATSRRIRDSRTKQDRSGKRRVQRSHSYARSHAPAEKTAVDDSDSDASVEEVSLKLPHILAAHEIQMQHSERPKKGGYHKIPLKCKLDILQFLLEELLQMGVFAAEITRRHQITQCFWPASYLPLPSKQDLENLVNVDDCVVCNYPGNLVCCDGCTNSYHKRCVTTSEMWDLPPGKWLCPECTIVDSAKLGPLHAGSRAELSWWSYDDWKRVQDDLCKKGADEETATLTSEPKGALDDTNTDSKRVSPAFKDLGTESVDNGHNGTKQISRKPQHATSTGLDGHAVGGFTGDNNVAEAPPGDLKDTTDSHTEGVANETDTQKPSNGPAGESVDETKSMSDVPLGEKQHKMGNERENEEAGKKYDQLQEYLRKNEFLVVHGLVFVRSRALHREWQDGMQGAVSCTSAGSPMFSSPVPLSQAQLRTLLLRLGPDVCIQWPWCQIPYDPYKIWPQFAKKPHSTHSIQDNQNQCSDSKLVEAFDALRNKFLAYFSGRKRYDPTSYANLYGRSPPAPLFLQYQPIPKHLIQFTTSNYEFLVSACMSTGILQMSSPVTCPVIHGMTRVMDDDAKLIESVRRCGRSADVLGPAKDYLVQLEKSLYKAYLLHEHWGLEEMKNPEAALGVFAESGSTIPLSRQPARHTAANRKWGDKLANAKTVARVAKCAVELVDAIESRAFYEEWNWQPGQTAAPPSLQGKDRTYSDLASDWSPSKAVLRRKWERGDSLMESRRLLLGDAANAMEQTGKRIVTIGRKRGRKAQHRLVVMEPMSAVSGMANTQGSGLSPGLPMSSGLPSLTPRRKPRAPGSGERTGHPTKLTRYYVKCVHCGEVPAVGIKANEPQLATKDLLVHLKGCPGCPKELLGLLCTLQSDGTGSSDSTAFFVTLLSRIRSIISNASVEDDEKDGMVTAEKSDKAGSEKPWIVSVDQTNVDRVFDFEGNRYPLVRPEDRTTGSKFTIALFKHFVPSPRAAVGESSVASSTKRAPTSGRRAKEANLRKGQVKDRYYVACVHCGHTPAHGIKIHGPQHATKDLFYHVRDCSMCPQQIKYLVAKLRGQGERSPDSAAFFRQQLQRIRAFLDNPPLSDGDRKNDISKDEFSEAHVFSFDANKYPLVRPEDHQMASKYFVALYKNFRPIVPASDEQEGSSDGRVCAGTDEVTRDLGNHGKRTTNALNSDGNVGDGADRRVRISDDVTVCMDNVEREESCDEISSKKQADGTSMAVGHDDKTKAVDHQSNQMKPPIEKGPNVQSVNDTVNMDQTMRGKDATNIESKDGIVSDADENRKATKVEVAEDKKGLSGGSSIDASAMSNAVLAKENEGTGIDEKVASADKKDSAHKLTESADAIATDGAKSNNSLNRSGIGGVGAAKLSGKADIENGGAQGCKKEDASTGHLETNRPSAKTGPGGCGKDEDTTKKSEQKSATGTEHSCKEESIARTNGSSDKDKLSSPSEKTPPAKDASSPGRGKKKRRKKQSRDSASTKRRRSGRVKLRNAVHDEIGTFAIPLASTSSSAVARPTTGISKSTSDVGPSKAAAITPQNAMDAEVMIKERNTRIAELEKLLSEPFEKEIHWPICGRKAFPPPGSLPPAIVRHLGRNAGMKMAPFMQYSDKFEVGRSSVRHIWRTETLECGTVEDLYLQIRILAAHVNRPTVHSCETLGRRSNSARSVVQKVIKCSHRDPATGMIEYFVVNRGKNRGCWLPEDTVDLSSFILMKSGRVQEAKQKNSARVAEKKRKEEEKRRKAAAELEAKRRKAAAEAEAKRRAAAEAEAKRRAEEREATRRAVQEAEAKRQAAADAEAKQRAEMAAQWKPSNQVTASAANLTSVTGGRGRKLASRGRGRPKGRRNKNSEVEEQYVVAFQQAFHQHKLDTKQLLKDAADAGLKAVPEGKMGATRLRNREAMRAANEMLRKLGSKRSVSEEEVIKKLSEAETIGVDMHVKAETLRLSGQPAAQTAASGQSRNGGPSVDDFSRAFHAAFYQHQLDTRQLLKDAADSGLDTVPSDKMSQVRMKNLNAMKEANDGLHKVGSQLHVADNDLTKKLVEAESLGMQMHVKTETERQRQGSSSLVLQRSKGSVQNSQPHHHSVPGSFGNDAKYQNASTAQQNYNVQSAQLSTAALQQTAGREVPRAKETVASFASSHGRARVIDAVTNQHPFRQDEATGHRYESSTNRLLQHQGESLTHVARPHQRGNGDTRSSNFARQSEDFRFSSGQQRVTVTDQIYRAKQKYELSFLQNMDERNLQDRTSRSSDILQGRPSNNHLHPSQQRHSQQMGNDSYYTDSQQVEGNLPSQVSETTQQSDWQHQAAFSEQPRQLNPPESHSQIQASQTQQQVQGSQISLAQQLLSQQAPQQHAFPQEGPQYGTDQDQQRSQNISQFSSSQKEQRAYFMSQAQNLQPQDQQGGALNYAYQQNDAKNGFDRW